MSEYIEALPGVAAGRGALLGVVAPAAGIDAEALSQSQRIDAACEIEVLRAWLAAQEARLWAAMDAEPGDPPPLGYPVSGEQVDKQAVRDELAAALRLSAGVVSGRLFEARRLVDRLPNTLELLESGRISARHAGVLVEATTVLDVDDTRLVEAAVLGRAARQTVAAFRRSVHRAVLRVAPQAADERRRRSFMDRHLRRVALADDMAELIAYLPAPDVTAIFARITDLVSRATGPEDTRTLDQRRADIFRDVLTDALVRENAPERQRRRRRPRRGVKPLVHVTVSLSTLLGCDDEPGELQGYGPIGAEMARALAFDPTGTWQRVLTDPVTVIDVSQAYQPPPRMDEHVRVRDKTCRFPGCPRTARRAELDHRRRWSDGGPTSIDNLQCLCSRHHHLKEEAGWTVRKCLDGSLHWTSPTGHSYRAPPDNPAA